MLIQPALAGSVVNVFGSSHPAIKGVFGLRTAGSAHVVGNTKQAGRDDTIADARIGVHPVRLLLMPSDHNSAARPRARTSTRRATATRYAPASSAARSVSPSRWFRPSASLPTSTSARSSRSVFYGRMLSSRATRSACATGRAAGLTVGVDGRGHQGAAAGPELARCILSPRCRYREC